MFKKYIHLERMTSEEVAGLTDLPCFILPKLDGANASIWHDDEKICCGSRNNQLDANNTLQGFYGFVQENKNLNLFFKAFPTATIYGEWLVPHTIKGYIDTAWRKFYAFDVFENCNFWPHDNAISILESCNIEVIPIIGYTDKTTPENALEACTWLLQEGHKHEGVVIKRSNFVNKFGRTTYGKYVPVPMLDIGRGRKGKKIAANKDEIEQEVINDFLTEHLINKEIAKIQIERGFTTLEPKLVGESLGRVWHAFITEEMWDALKKFKNPQIDFSLLKKLCNQKVREKFGV